MFGPPSTSSSSPSPSSSLSPVRKRQQNNPKDSSSNTTSTSLNHSLELPNPISSSSSSSAKQSKHPKHNNKSSKSSKSSSYTRHRQSPPRLPPGLHHTTSASQHLVLPDIVVQDVSNQDAIRSSPPRQEIRMINIRSNLMDCLYFFFRFTAKKEVIYKSSEGTVHGPEKFRTRYTPTRKAGDDQPKTTPGSPTSTTSSLSSSSGGDASSSSPAGEFRLLKKPPSPPPPPQYPRRIPGMLGSSSSASRHLSSDPEDQQVLAAKPNPPGSSILPQYIQNIIQAELTADDTEINWQNLSLVEVACFATKLFGVFFYWAKSRKSQISIRINVKLCSIRDSITSTSRSRSTTRSC